MRPLETYSFTLSYQVVSLQSVKVQVKGNQRRIIPVSKLHLFENNTNISLIYDELVYWCGNEGAERVVMIQGRI